MKDRKMKDMRIYSKQKDGRRQRWNTYAGLLTIFSATPTHSPIPNFSAVKASSNIHNTYSHWAAQTAHKTADHDHTIPDALSGWDWDWFAVNIGSAVWSRPEMGAAWGECGRHCWTARRVSWWYRFPGWTKRTGRGWMGSPEGSSFLGRRRIPTAGWPKETVGERMRERWKTDGYIEPTHKKVETIPYRYKMELI